MDELRLIFEALQIEETRLARAASVVLRISPSHRDVVGFFGLYASKRRGGRFQL